MDNLYIIKKIEKACHEEIILERKLRVKAELERDMYKEFSNKKNKELIIL